MALGLIARGDDGGLGTMTREFHRHLQPERTLVVDLGSLGRGQTRPERFAHGEVLVTNGWPSRREVEWLLDGIDVVYTAEIPYERTLFQQARARGVRSIVHAMPELFDPDEWPEPPDEVWLPTEWHHGGVRARYPVRSVPFELRVVPVPVPLDLFEVRTIERLEVAVHATAPAMLDRAGTTLVCEAAGLTRRPLRWWTRGLHWTTPPPGGWPAGVRVAHWTAREFHDWPSADLLVAPRRYGGLSLPLLEAAAQGVPALVLDREPERSLPFTITVPVTRTTRHAMKGGMFEVADADPRALAAALDRLTDEKISRKSFAARQHAARVSWEALLPLYRAMLNGERTGVC